MERVSGLAGFVLVFLFRTISPGDVFSGHRENWVQTAKKYFLPVFVRTGSCRSGRSSPVVVAVGYSVFK